MKARYFGNAMPRINVEDAREIPIPIPPVAEQSEITRQLGLRLERLERGVCEGVRSACDHWANLDRAILSKAFRGELVPQDPNDEPVPWSPPPRPRPPSLRAPGRLPRADRSEPAGVNARAYPIVDVDPRGERGGEAMGTKDKFWWRDPRDEEGPSWLFKYARENTGEHWSEKIASEVGRLLGVPAAQVELGSCEGRPGSLSLGFAEAGVLVHGNELLQEVARVGPAVECADCVSPRASPARRCLATTSGAPRQSMGGSLVLVAMPGPGE
jgi:hypothetical protein